MLLEDPEYGLNLAEHRQIFVFHCRFLLVLIPIWIDHFESQLTIVVH